MFGYRNSGVGATTRSVLLDSSASVDTVAFSRVLIRVSCLQFTANSGFNSLHWTNNHGAPVWNNNNSETVGVRGPILMEDYQLMEKLANVRIGFLYACNLILNM
jgi:hypothetical protein